MNNWIDSTRQDLSPLA